MRRKLRPPFPVLQRDAYWPLPAPGVPANAKVASFPVDQTMGRVEPSKYTFSCAEPTIFDDFTNSTSVGASRFDQIRRERASDPILNRVDHAGPLSNDLPIAVGSLVDTPMGVIGIRVLNGEMCDLPGALTTSVPIETRIEGRITLDFPSIVAAIPHHRPDTSDTPQRHPTSVHLRVLSF